MPDDGPLALPDDSDWESEGPGNGDGEDDNEQGGDSDDDSDDRESGDEEDDIDLNELRNARLPPNDAGRRSGSRSPEGNNGEHREYHKKLTGSSSCSRYRYLSTLSSRLALPSEALRQGWSISSKQCSP